VILVDTNAWVHHLRTNAAARSGARIHSSDRAVRRISPTLGVPIV
jgi:hypothetical protein